MPAQAMDDVRRTPAVLTADGTDSLIAALTHAGYEVIGPRAEAGAITLGTIARAGDLPIGIRDEQTPGQYRATKSGGREVLGHAAPGMPWKRFLYPPDERLFHAVRGETGLDIEGEGSGGDEPPLALFAIRPCDLAAIAILDAILADEKRVADERYRTRRERTFIVAADCTHAAETCFCASMGIGPRAVAGFDLVLSEVPTGANGTLARLLVAAGTEEGAVLLAGMALAEATAEDRAAAEDAVAGVGGTMKRTMPDEIAAVLPRHLNSPIWDEIAGRCLGCGNCTMVCPTCFCASVEDTTDLDGTVAERRRVWDSCFTLEHSYIHGGRIRTSAAARYRQWMCHKLSFWHGQFGMSGCVGCGRCITWCPVGIDIVEEAWRFAREEEGR